MVMSVPRTPQFDGPIRRHGGRRQPTPGRHDCLRNAVTNGGGTDILEAGQFFQKLTGAVKMGQSSIESGPVIRYARFFIRFRDVFGTAAGQVPPDVPITSAKLHLYNDNDLGPERAKSTPDGEFTPEIETTPKLNAGTIGLYPMLVSPRWGTNDGLANKEL